MSEFLVPKGIVSNAELVALGILIAGFIVARLASAGTGTLLNALDKRAARSATTDSSILSPQLIRVVRSFAFWLVLILAAAVALQVLGVGGVSSILDNVIGFIPQVLIGFLIVVAGHLLGLLASNLVIRLDQQMTIGPVVPRLLHAVIVTAAVVMGLQQVGVDISFVTRLLLILIGVIGGGLVLAFALGSRQHVANLMAHRELARLVIGERIRIDDIEGTVAEIHATGVDIATSEGIASVPSSRFASATLVRMGAGKNDE